MLWIALGLVMQSGVLSAQDAAAGARFNAKAVLISARVVYLSTQSYAGVTPKLLEERNPGLRILGDAPSTGPAVLSVQVLGPREFRIAVYGGKTCWGIQETGLRSAVATVYAKRDGLPRSCSAHSFKGSDFTNQEGEWWK